MGCKCMPLAVEGKKKNRYLVIDGEVTINTVADLKPQVVKAISKTAHYQIDLSKVEECDTSGLQLIYSMLLTLVKNEKEFIITELSSTVSELLSVTGVQFPETPIMVEA